MASASGIGRAQCQTIALHSCRPWLHPSTSLNQRCFGVHMPCNRCWLAMRAMRLATQGGSHRLISESTVTSTCINKSSTSRGKPTGRHTFAFVPHALHKQRWHGHGAADVEGEMATMLVVSSAIVVFVSNFAAPFQFIHTLSRTRFCLGIPFARNTFCGAFLVEYQRFSNTFVW